MTCCRASIILARVCLCSIELFYQLLVYNFGNMGHMRLSVSRFIVVSLSGYRLKVQLCLGRWTLLGQPKYTTGVSWLLGAL